MNRPRFVLDTSVIVSAALLARSVPRRAFDVAIQQGYVLFADGLQAELSDVLLLRDIAILRPADFLSEYGSDQIQRA